MKTVVTNTLWQDEQGGGTVMGLMWFMMLVGICGMAVDSTDGFRSKTMLQATADSSALAAVIDLPDASAAVATAVSYSTDNMNYQTYGTVLDPADVEVGLWDPVTRTIEVGAANPDAVMVTTGRSSGNGNALQTNFLRIAGWKAWDITAQAVAQRFIPNCLKDGLVARKKVDIESINGFFNEICIHGEQGVDMQIGNYFETGVNISMPDMDLLSTPSGSLISNPGLPDALRENHLDPRMVNHIDEIIQGMLDKDPAVVPDYIDLSKDVIVADNHLNLANALPHRIYHVKCKPMQNMVLPAGILIDKIVLIADCQITIGASSTIYDSFIASRSGPTPGGNTNLNRGDANITTAAGVQLGKPDECAEGGGVQLFSNATLIFASSTMIDGVQMVALGDIALGAQASGINGIAAQSGGNIFLTSGNMFGACSGGAPNLFTVGYYRLVR